MTRPLVRVVKRHPLWWNLFPFVRIVDRKADTGKRSGHVKERRSPGWSAFSFAFTFDQSARVHSSAMSLSRPAWARTRIYFPVDLEASPRSF